MQSMESGVIFDIKKFSIHDGPGIRTTVFMKGCPLSCCWCHNPESQLVSREKLYAVNRCIGCMECIAVCPENAIRNKEIGLFTDPDRCMACGSCADACLAEACEMAGREMTVNQVLDEIEKDTAFHDESFGGVTFSGGEPLAQPDFLFALLKACKDRQIHTALDTSGFSTRKVLDRIRHYVDVFLFDLKGIKDDKDNVLAIGAFVSGLPLIPPIDLLPYHNLAAAKFERLGKSYRLHDHGLHGVGPRQLCETEHKTPEDMGLFRS